MARTIFYVFLTQMISNGFWLAFKFNRPEDEFALFTIPVIVLVVFIGFAANWIVQNWD